MKAGSTTTQQHVSLRQARAAWAVPQAAIGSVLFEGGAGPDGCILTNPSQAAAGFWLHKVAVLPHQLQEVLL